MKLASIYDHAGAEKHLFDLLSERDADVNISHKRMPKWEQHLRFVRSRPYRAWYLVLTDDGEVAGAVYLSKQNEIGVFLYRAHQGKGVGSDAVRKLMALHPCRKFLANIGPKNSRSLAMFERLGFRHVQNTLALEGRASAISG